MSEASRSMIDGMMERLGEMADLVGGDQERETALLPGPGGVDSRDPPAMVDLFPERDRGVGNGCLSPTITYSLG